MKAKKYPIYSEMAGKSLGADTVSVEIYSLLCDGIVDVIMCKIVTVDTERVVNSAKLLHHGIIGSAPTEAQLQRLGIREFDKLLAAHPTLSVLSPQETQPANTHGAIGGG